MDRGWGRGAALQECTESAQRVHRECTDTSEKVLRRHSPCGAVCGSAALGGIAGQRPLPQEDTNSAASPQLTDDETCGDDFRAALRSQGVVRHGWGTGRPPPLQACKSGTVRRVSVSRVTDAFLQLVDSRSHSARGRSARGGCTAANPRVPSQTCRPTCGSGSETRTVGGQMGKAATEVSPRGPAASIRSSKQVQLSNLAVT